MIEQLLAGRYKVLQVLGAGGFGKTYIVEDIHLPGKPKCVLKHLSPASNDPQILDTARRLFQKEAETLQQLGNHEQIPRLLAYFEENQEFYLVQEFINGHTLGQELPRGQQWTENQIIEMLLELLNILGFVHSQGVIHRDLKPDNIIRRTADNKLVLIDFGAIKQVRNQSVMAGSQASVSVAIGTPGYMPTEQSRGIPRPSSDIYALGMIGIQALTGVYPHEFPEDPQTGEILWQHIVAASPGLITILQKMTRYHFKDRYQTADEALAALKILTNPVSTPTVQATPANSTRQELTLEWLEAGQVRTETIFENQPSINPGKVRIGRDPAQCDIVLSEPTVSGLHIEIFFNSQQQSFYLRSLRENNPPLVNGQSFPVGEVMLDEGSSIGLGQLNLRVKAVKVQRYAAGYTPTEYVTQPQNITPQPVAKTLQVQPVQPSWNSQQNTTPVAPVNPLPSPPPPTPVPASRSKLPLFIGLGVATFVSVAGFAVISRLNTSNSTSDSNSTISSTSQDSCFVVVTGNIRSEPASFRDNVVKSASEEKLNITGKQTGGGWIEVKLPNSNLAWAHRDVIANDGEMDSCVQKNKISVQTVDDIPRPAPTPQAKQPQEQPSSTSEAPTNSEPETPTNTAYQEGLVAGEAKGREDGQTDGAANEGKGAMHINASCDNPTGNQEYDQGFQKGCFQTYRESFQAAREEIINKEQSGSESKSESESNSETETPAEPEPQQ
ncbi:serine/threonine protein kinase [Cylindrospermum sp. NIES-4074]|nr:serine/threonine protein kinase [Cylindrospermum sp. NIES-4074]